MKPVVALIGRPNVGKSTLFNALTRTRNALVADWPGLTHDRQYGDGVIGGKPYFVVDTGGLTGEGDTLMAEVAEQTRFAMLEADAVILLVDGREGPNALDRAIASDLRRQGRPVFLAVNKSEGRPRDLATAEFHDFGPPPFAISAAQGSGLAALMEAVLAGFPEPVAEAETEASGPRVAVAGRPNVGKSTLINTLLGEVRMLVSDQPGTTRDSIRIPLTRGGRGYVLIDTAGVRRRPRVEDAVEKITVIKTLQAIDEAHVVILLLDARQEVSEQDVHLAGYILEKGRALVLAVNKWDGLEESRRDWIRREVERRLPFLAFAPPLFISARTALHVERLFPAIDRAHASAHATLATARLNRVLEQAVAATPPPIHHGRRIKLKFAHQGGHNPPRVVIHGNQVAAVPEAYRRYLANCIRRAFRLEGTPVWIDFEQGENPYAGRRVRQERRQSGGQPSAARTAPWRKR